MRIEIHAGKFSLTDKLRKHIERRIQFALSWAHQNLNQVTLRFNDINGPKGGADKSCRIKIPIAVGKHVVIEEVQSDLYIAIDRAIERAARTLRRQLARKREHSHRRYRLASMDDSTLATP